MYSVYEALPAGFKQRIAGLRLKHDGTYNSGGYVRQGVTPVDDPRTSPGTYHPLGLHASGNQAAHALSWPPKKRLCRKSVTWQLRNLCSMNFGRTPSARNSPGTMCGGWATWSCGTIAARCTGAMRSTLPRAASCIARRSRERHGRQCEQRYNPEVRRSPSSAVRPRLANRMLVVLCLMYLLLYVDRVNIATVAPQMTADLKLTHAQFGFAVSAFAYPYALFQLVGGWIGDRLGPRLALTICGAVVCLATILTGLAGGFASLVAVRLALGFGEGAAFPTATRAMSLWIPARSWGFAQGITHAAARLGNALTPLLVAGVLAYVSWRMSFVVIGAISVTWIILWQWVSPRRSGRPAETVARCRNRLPHAASFHPMDKARAAHPSGNGSRLLLWLDAMGFADLASLILSAALSPRSPAFCAIFVCRPFQRRRRECRGRHHQRSPLPAHRQLACGTAQPDNFRHVGRIDLPGAGRAEQ